MKILHIADLHLGAKNSKLSKEKQEILTDEMFENVHLLFEKIAPKNDVVVICGDLFHAKNVAVKISKQFFYCVQNYAKPVIYICGNHDEKFDFDSLPDNFVFLTHENPSFVYGDTIFCCKEGVANIEKDKNNVLLLHGNIESTKDNDYVDISDFLTMDFDYIALGHTHQVKKYKKGNKIFAYSGSLFSNGFDECGDKGYIEVEIENKEVKKCQFVALPQRRYQLCEVDISSCKSNGDIIEKIKHSFLEKKIEERDVVRIVLKGYYDELLRKSENIILQGLESCFYVELVDQSKLKLDIQKLKLETLSLKNEFISLVENSDLSQEQKQKIIAIGIEALKGDDLSL